MKKSILLILLTFFFTMNITGCSIFSSDEEEAETATVAEDSVDVSNDEFGADDFEEGDDTDFDAEAMAQDDGDNDGMVGLEDLDSEEVVVEDTFASSDSDDDGMFGLDDSETSDEYPDDDFAEEGTTQEAKVATSDSGFPEDDADYIDDNSFGDDSDASDSLFVDEGSSDFPADTMASNQEEDLFAQDDLEPVVDTPTYADNTFDSTYDSGAILDVPTQNWVPVKKMKPAAYRRAGGNVNRLYVVRAGDNMDSIAEKLYGNSAEAERLYNFNSHFRGKTLNVGDKIYYESPKSPNDQRMLTYYEDNNMSPSYYTSQEGDNIRKVSKQLLGHERSWMEIYATNESVASKGRLPAGLRLRYWQEGAAAAAPVMAMNKPEPTPPPMPEPEPMEEPEEMTEPDPVAMEGSMDEVPDMEDPMVDPMNDPVEKSKEMAKLDEPDAIDNMDSGDEDFTPPPAVGAVNNTPPPPKPIAPPPPPPAPKPDLRKPPPPKVANLGNDDPLAAMGDDQTIMAALGGLLILAAVIMLIFIRRSRAKRVNFSQTQV
jgi:hypothetical protein